MEAEDRAYLAEVDKLVPWAQEAIPASPAAQPGLAIFNSSEFGDIRTIMEDGKPLFCAKDVALALGYADSDQAVRAHCKSVQTCPVDFTGQVRHVKFIPESDVYRLVMRSKLPGAERFQDWVVEEVLPTIRKTGRFEIAPAVHAVPQTYLEALRAHLASEEKVVEQAKLIEEQ
jgi:anti-repressor protein